MPTKLTRIELYFTKAQRDDLKRRFPDLQTLRAQIYRALEFDPPKHGGKRKGAGRKPDPFADLPAGRLKSKKKEGER